jgi:Na+/proline symporter
MQMVLGYLLGYTVIITVLLPLYYKLQLTSIYTYLEGRFGPKSYKTGAVFFLISRTIGSAFRLYLSAMVLQFVLFDKMHLPFVLSVSIVVFFIYLFTYKGGIKTVVYTDTIQTAFMLASLIGCVLVINHKLGINFSGMVHTVADSSYSKIFFFDDWNDKKHFIKQFFSGAFIAIVMTGLDQDLMQKNLSCKSINDAQKNMLWYSLAFIPVNFVFLSLGVMLYVYAAKMGLTLPAHSDQLFPMIATSSEMPAIFIAIFIIGLVSCTYSSADSALTALTTSFTIDIMQANKKGEVALAQTRRLTHILMSVLLVVLILIFKLINNQSVISAVFVAAGYTYGPLLGLFSFGLFTKRKVRDRFVPWVCLFSPIICYILNLYSQILFNGYKFGYEILMLNGLLTFVGLYIISIGLKTSETGAIIEH